MTFDIYLRYMQQQASPAEAHAVQAWLAAPANAALAQAWLSHYAELLEQEEGPATAAPELEAVQAQLLVQLGLAPAPLARPARRWPHWLAAAVLLGGALMGGVLLWPRTPAALPLTTLSTAYGEQRTVHLPDGSTVKLNGHSTLRYAAGFGQPSKREVWLDGEGYFQVRHLPDHSRFVVHTAAGLEVAVLGTEFTVFHRRAQARVVLLTGKVQVAFADAARSPTVTLKPGELLATYDAQPQRIEHKAVDTNLYAAWLRNRLVFDETSLADVAAQLSDAYGVAITFDNRALRRYKVSGTFPLGNLDALLRFLEKSFPLTVQRQANRIRISSSSPSVSI